MRRSSAAALAAWLALGCVTPPGPPFTWDPNHASPGTALALHEVSRVATSRGTELTYRIHATGFASAAEPVLWWHIGADYEQIPVVVTAAGVVQVIPGVDDFIIDEFSSGQTLDLALADAGSGVRAQAKIVPFPIEARAEAGCAAAVELHSRSGRVFLVVLSGFAPGESVHTSHRFGTAVIDADRAVWPSGGFQFPVLFAPDDEGTASLTATGRACSVTLSYRVGRAALDRP